MTFISVAIAIHNILSVLSLLVISVAEILSATRFFLKLTKKKETAIPEFVYLSF